MGGSPKHSEFCTTSKMAVSTKAPTFLGQIYQTMRRVAYNASGFNKYGLMHDDVLYETPDVEEALRRPPTKLIDERNFRITRALQYSGQKKFLAKEDWTKYEEDVRYLQPYLTEVIKERLEKEAWDRNKHYGRITSIPPYKFSTVKTR